MLIARQPPVHLTYCLNVHPGESWDDQVAAIRTGACRVRDGVAPDRPFGLGLRLSHAAAAELDARPAERERFAAFLAAQRMYVFTVNGFPFGHFHGARVKDDVYRPDWSDPQRRDYTLRLAGLLAGMLPETVDGSISTVPLSYKGWHLDEAERERMVGHLAETAAGLAGLHERTGRRVRVALEPEPDCLLETTEETLAFFGSELPEAGARHLARTRGVDRAVARRWLRRYLGVCLDTCHLALQFEDPADALRRFSDAGIAIPKIQLSAALKAAGDDEARREKLAAFRDPVYLHQVRIRRSDGVVLRRTDLDTALDGEARGEIAPGSEWRVHYHVPLYMTGDPPLQSTADTLTPSFFKAAREAGVRHFEIETYTFDVLPPPLQTRGLVQSLRDEYAWVLKRMTND